jgi:mannose-6-phosphate isomerase
VLGVPSGKTEAYYVLGVRDDSRSGYRPEAVPSGFSNPRDGSGRKPELRPEPTGYIYVGFQRPPTPAQLRDYIVTQNIAAIESCFDRIPVKAGDAFIIPGGTPHALGAGVFMVEIQEPSDLVIRFEFERAGYVLPEAVRFMGRDVDFALTVFDFTPLNPFLPESRVRCWPRRLRELGPDSWQDELVGPAQTDCFRVMRTRVGAAVTKAEASSVVAIVTSGRVMVETGEVRHQFDIYEKFFLPAGLGSVKLTPLHGPAEILECAPPR